LNIWELQQSNNINELLEPEKSAEIGRDVVEGWTTDKESRYDWEKRMEDAIKLALQMTEEKTYPWPKSSNVKFPLITIAALQFSARAYPALVKAPNIVKYRVTGEDKDGTKAGRASRISQHMSYQLMEEDENWEEDFDKALITLPIVGTVFKKSFFDSVKGHNVSKLTLPQNLVVSYYTRTIEDCERKTEEFELYDREIKERQLRKIYSEVELGHIPVLEKKIQDERQGLQEPTQDKKKARPLLEQHCYLDLDDDGYPEPYVVTVDRSSKKILRIAARFAKIDTEQSLKIKQLTDQFKLLKIQIQQIVSSIPQPKEGEQPTDQHLQAAQQAEQQVMAVQQKQYQLQEQIKVLEEDNKKNPKVLLVKAEEHYTKFGFIPSPDGGFYDLGLGALLGPLNDSVNTLINQLIDSGTMNNGSHGFIGRGGNIKGGKIRFEEPFEWIRVNTPGAKLRDSLVPLPVNQPSAVLFNLLSLLIGYAEKVSSVTEAMSGGNPGQNTPAYTQQSMLEQGLQVFNGIFKRSYRSFRSELRKLYVLNSTYLKPMEYFETLDGPANVLQNDYSGDPKDCVPATNPNAFSDMAAMQTAQFLAQRSAQVPHYSGVGVERRLLESMDIPDIQDVYPLDESGQPLIPAPKNPELEIQVSEEQRKTLESKARQETNQALAESKMDVDQSTVLLNMHKAKAIDDKTFIDKHEAITKRMKVRSDGIKTVVESEDRERDRQTGSGD